MRAKEWFKLLISYGLMVVMAGVIIWALLALYQPTFDEVRTTTTEAGQPPLEP